MTQRTIHILTGADIQEIAQMRDAIEWMRDAFSSLSSGRVDVPLRTRISIADGQGDALFMPAHEAESGTAAVKVVSVLDENPARGLPRVQAAILLMDAEDGCLLALMDGEVLTALRTGAGSGLATDLLARSDATRVAIFGAGTQARTQLRAVCAVRDIEGASVVARDPAHAAEFAREMTERLAVRVDPATPAEALATADIVCTATISKTPLFEHADLREGVHINAVGAFGPQAREIPTDTVAAAKLVVDQRAACLAEAGDIVIPIEKGAIDEDHVHAEIGEIVLGSRPGRESSEEITLFKSVGNAVQDLVTANRVYQRAVTGEKGLVIKL